MWKEEIIPDSFDAMHKIISKLNVIWHPQKADYPEDGGSEFLECGGTGLQGTKQLVRYLIFFIYVFSF
jgi:hypothetical protein